MFFSCLHQPVVSLALLTLFTIPLAAEEEAMPIVDTHVHLWVLERPEGIYWISKDDPILYRTMLPTQHQPIALANGVGGVVVVQAGQSLPDNEWNLKITSHNPRLYRGVVGNLSKVIGTKAFKPLFLKLCRDSRYVGYRLSGKYQDTLSDEFFEDLELTAKRGKTVDFLVGGYSLEQISQIAKRVPNLKIILDHFGGARLSDQPLDQDWATKLRAVAKASNVYCKVSALYGRFEQQPAPSDIRVYEPMLDLVFDCFGEDRLVFGSDWPVTKTTGDYASVIALTRAYFDQKGAIVSEKVFTSNACRFYGIDQPINSSQVFEPRTFTK
ncbi:MAG: amidohydrolase family protein [Rubripirellula sp.]|nr:amidohydrolase family protein [Rubripirellula sp.]